MKDTFDKLDEAKYFLSQLKVNIINVSKFKYNLSAFLSAIRSVTFFLQKECGHLPGFKEWYSEKQESMKKDPCMTFFNEKRISEIHIQRNPLRKETKVTYHDEVSLVDSVIVFLVRSDGSADIRQSGPGVHKMGEKVEPKAEHLWYFEDFKDKDLIQLCEEHIIKIETLLNDYKKILPCIPPLTS
jgi:hypothetical protein